MKKIISAFLVAVICLSSVSAFAAGKLGYSKVYNKADIRLTPVDSPEAVIVVAQYMSGKLIDMDIIDVVQPDEVYVTPSVEIEDGIDYEFFVYDNIRFENELFESIKINSKTADKLYVNEYLDAIFKKVE